MKIYQSLLRVLKLRHEIFKGWAELTAYSAVLYLATAPVLELNFTDASVNWVAFLLPRVIYLGLFVFAIRRVKIAVSRSFSALIPVWNFFFTIHHLRVLGAQAADFLLNADPYDTLPPKFCLMFLGIVAISLISSGALAIFIYLIRTDWFKTSSIN